MKTMWTQSNVAEAMMVLRICDLREEFGIKIIPRRRYQEPPLKLTG